MRGVANPQTDEDGVNLRTLQASATSVLEQATVAANKAVGDAITNHTNILNRDIRAKSLNLDPHRKATRNFSMGEQYHIVGLPDPTVDHEAVNLRTLNRKIEERSMRPGGENQIVSDIQMNHHKVVGLADAVAPTDGVNKKVLDAAVNSLRSENEQLILATNENINQRVMFLDGTSLPEVDMNFNGKKITNLGQPVEPDDAATKRFVGDILRKRTIHVNPEGAQENLKMNNHIISGLANPTERNDAVHKHYVDSQIQNLRGLVANLTHQVDSLQTRVVMLEQLSHGGLAE